MRLCVMLPSVFRAVRTARMLQYSRSFRAGVALRAWDDGTRSYPEKSETCSSSTGAPLTEYYSSDAAQRGAFHVIERYGTVLEPYQCDQCSLWHLAPSDSPMLTSGGPTRMPSFEEHGDDDYAMSAFEAVDEAAYSARAASALAAARQAAATDVAVGDRREHGDKHGDKHGDQRDDPREYSTKEVLDSLEKHGAFEVMR